MIIDYETERYYCWTSITDKTLEQVSTCVDPAGPCGEEGDLERVNAAAESRPRNPRTGFRWASRMNGGQGATDRPFVINHTGAPNDLLARAGITPEDVTESLQAQRRQENGEFVLKTESPFLRKLDSYRYKSLAAQAAATNAENYNRVFGGLGLRPEVSSQLQGHLAKIYQASLEAESSIAQLLEARLKYDERVRSALGEDGYLEYRRFEASKPLQAEMESIKSCFQGERQHQLEPAYAQMIATAIGDSNACENNSWHGPYDHLPQVTIGIGQVTEWTRSRIERIQQTAGRVMLRAQELGVPEEYLAFLAGYYDKQARELQDGLERFSKPQTWMEDPKSDNVKYESGP